MIHERHPAWCTGTAVGLVSCVGFILCLLFNATCGSATGAQLPHTAESVCSVLH